MQHYCKSSSGTYNLKYHLVWIAKYRKLELHSEFTHRLCEWIRLECQRMEVGIINGDVVKDHVLVTVSVRPK